MKIDTEGLSWWPSGSDSYFQHKEPEFDPWSEN